MRTVIRKYIQINRCRNKRVSSVTEQGKSEWRLRKEGGTKHEDVIQMPEPRPDQIVVGRTLRHSLNQVLKGKSRRDGVISENFGRVRLVRCLFTAQGMSLKGLRGEVWIP